MKILIIDDDIPLTTVYRSVCSNLGYDTIVVNTGNDALDVIENDKDNDIGIVLLDLNLPDISGLEICKIIRKTNKSLDIYILLITGDGDNDIHVRALDLGADDFISKPVNLKILQGRINVGIRSVVAHRDLLEQKAVTEKLYHENEFFKTGFDDSAQPYFITDLNGIITYANHAVELFYGYTLDNLIGKHTRILNAGLKEYINRGYSKEYYNDLFSDMWKNIQDTSIGNWQGDLINRTKSGTIKDVHIQIGTIHTKNGVVAGFTSFIWDLTDFKKRERENRDACFRTIVDLAELRDNETGEHLQRISKYTVLLSQELGLTQKFIDNINDFSAFHDIGKVGVPDAILLAPRKLTNEEFDIIKGHPTIGYDLLKKTPSLKFAAEIAISHHEKWDGSGYPNSLAGEEIPLSGRITAVADVYDALRTKRPYKNPWPHERTVELIKSESGKHFDPAITKAFLKIESVFEEISDSYF